MQVELNFFVLRTPLLSLERLLSLLAKDSLSLAIQDPLVGEAIQIASPTFYAQLQQDPNLSNPKLRQSVLKYLLRMGSRCTPFGLFAGCSVGEFSSTSKLNLTRRQIDCHHWLDMGVLWEIAQELNLPSGLRAQLRYQPNNSIYSIGKQVRYSEAIHDPGQQTQYVLSQVESSQSVRLVLQLARQGATPRELVFGLCTKGYDETDARELVNRMIDDQVLISELTPFVTGPDCLGKFIDIISPLSGTLEIVDTLQRIQALLSEATESANRESKIRACLTQSFDRISPSTPILQTDTFFRKGTIQLSSAIYNTLKSTFDKLAPLAQFTGTPSQLKTFKQRFYARYEEREIPLLLALDTETGIGYGDIALSVDMPLLKAILPSKEKAAEAVLTSDLQQWLIQCYSSWLEGDEEVLQLTDQDLATLPSLPIHRQQSYYAFGYFLSPSQNLDQQYQFKLNVLGGPSAFPLLGRFCRNDASLTHQIKTAFDQLQQDDEQRIYAEVTHLPSPRAGNVLHRPHLRTYEIPYLAASTLPIEQQISLDDLWVSVPKGERVIIRSRRLKKEIIPCLTTAHAYQLGLPLYHFLGDLQQPEQSLSIRWNWGWLTQRRYLPRVQYKQIILAEACWRLSLSDLNPAEPDEINVQHWQEKWSIPRFIALVQGDQELFLDLSTLGCRQLLADSLRRLKTLRLIEWLRTPDQCPVQGADGRYTNEVILPFLHPLPKKPNPTWASRSNSVERTFVPGSEWLYLKVYCGLRTAEVVLEKLTREVHSLMRNRSVTHWFFIRYQDPEPHLRIRFHLSETIEGAFVLRDFQRKLQPLISSGEVHHVQVETYKREVERYGEQRMDATEWLFWADSEVVSKLCQYQLDQSQLLAAAVFGMDTFLTDFRFETEDKLKLCQQMFQQLFTEQSGRTDLQKKLAKIYRDNALMVRRILKRSELNLLELEYQQLFQKRSEQIKPFLKLLPGEQTFSAQYVASLLHLFINRLFDQHQRTYELLIYHHLVRGYQFLSAYKL